MNSYCCIMKKLILPFLFLFVATPVFAKLNCDQVTCDEARKYSYMDADKDGYYCEKQCGLYNPTVKKPTPKQSKVTTTKSKYML